MVCERPLVYVVDTPGIMLPHIPAVETGMKLAAVAALRDHAVGDVAIADYILYALNRQRAFAYVDLLRLPGPCDSIDSVLAAVARRTGALTRGGGPDIRRSAAFFIHRFRSGQLGRILL